MAVVRYLLVTLLVIFVLGVGREGHAVIYKYVDEKGDILFADDLQKIPVQKRSSAVMVSGAEAAPEEAAAERAEAAAKVEEVRREQADARQRHANAFRTRLTISLSGAAAVVVVLFVMGNIDALRSHAKVRKRVRAGLIAGLAVFLLVMHVTDVIGLFRRTGGTVSGGFSGIQEQQEERGRKAGAAIKAFNKMLDQAEREQEQHLEGQIEEAQQGR